MTTLTVLRGLEKALHRAADLIDEQNAAREAVLAAIAHIEEAIKELKAA